MSRRTPVDERFFAKVDPGGVCWQWTAATMKHGYGVFQLGKTEGTVLAHRWAYEYLVAPIPAGLQLDHLCRNRACVNPDHLEPVTSKTNTLRGSHPSAQNARKLRCPHCGGPYDVQNVTGRAPFRFCRPCQREWQRLNYHHKKAA